MKRLAIAIMMVAMLMLTGMAWADGDVKGWGKTRWGMSFREARRLYPDAEVREPSRLVRNDTASLILSGRKIAGRLIRINLLFTKSLRLRAVSIAPDTSDAPEDDWQALTDELTAKYGKPQKVEKNEQGSVYASWFFRSTRIVLKREALIDGIIYVEYEPNNAHGGDNL